MSAHKIVASRITYYPDNGQTLAYVAWSDGATTVGDPLNAHGEHT